jgi:CRP-like cAMP-binding protein
VYPLLRPDLQPILEQGDATLGKAMASRRCLFQPDTEIMSEDESHGFMYRLRTGWAARTRRLDDGRRQVIAIFLPGELMGVKAAFLERQPDAILCLSGVTADRLDHKTAFDLLTTDGAVAARIAFQLGEDERRLHNWVVGLGRADARERIAFFILDLYGRLRRIHLAGEQQPGFTLPMTQQQIGDHTGLTIVHVNRVLRHMREENLLSIVSRKVTIHNLAGLVKLAEPLLDTFQRNAQEYGSDAA